MISRRLLLGVLLAVTAACGAVTPVEARHKKPLTQALTIIDDKGRADRFNVEFVDTDASRERGLMYRTTLAPNAGMLFDFLTPQQTAFWMKNTYISLDIIFIGPDGHILNIAKQATPLSEDSLLSAGQVRGVLEIPGGRSDELDIGPGDLVKHPIFGTN